MQQQQITKQNQAALNQEQELQLKQHQQQILSNLRNINQQTANTLMTLNGQGEKINQIEHNLDQNQQKLNKIDYMLKVIKSPFGQFAALFTKPKQEKQQQQQNESQKQQTLQQPSQIYNDDIFDEMINQTNVFKYQQQLTNQTLKTQTTQLDRINQKADKQAVQLHNQNQQIKKIIK